MSANEFPDPRHDDEAPLPFQSKADDPPGLGERLRALRGDGDWIHRIPVRPLFVTALLLLALLGAGRFLTRSFREVPPGSAGVALNRFTGRVHLLAPGTHFLPRTLFGLTDVRVSDRLLEGQDATFTVSTKDGISVVVTIQARWAIDRGRLADAWSSLPGDPAREIVGPVLASSFRTLAPTYDATALLAEKRDELAANAGALARERLVESGLVLKEVLVSNLKLPEDFERGRLTLMQAAQEIDRKQATLKLKEKDIEQQRLEGEAEKVRKEKAAETEALQRLIAAKGESDAMQYILPLKEKAIEQQRLESAADREKRLKLAEAEAEAGKIQTLAEAERRRTLADAEAYAFRTTSLAQFENLKREAELIQANPVWVSKTFAERISDKVQVILTPNLTSSIFTDEVMKRVANGKQAVPRPEPQTAKAARTEPDPAPAGDPDDERGPQPGGSR